MRAARLKGGSGHLLTEHDIVLVGPSSPSVMGSYCAILGPVWNKTRLSLQDVPADVPGHYHPLNGMCIDVRHQTCCSSTTATGMLASRRLLCVQPS